MRRFALPALLRISFFTTLTIRSYGNGGCGVDPPAERGRTGLGCHYSFSPCPSCGRNEVAKGILTDHECDKRSGNHHLRVGPGWRSTHSGGMLAMAFRLQRGAAGIWDLDGCRRGFAARMVDRARGA